MDFFDSPSFDDFSDEVVAPKTNINNIDLSIDPTEDRSSLPKNTPLHWLQIPHRIIGSSVFHNIKYGLPF